MQDPDKYAIQTARNLFQQANRRMVVHTYSPDFTVAEHERLVAIKNRLLDEWQDLVAEVGAVHA